ncbi:MAG: CPBP family intramembrane metalloprotease [Ekhidna sp.]
MGIFKYKGDNRLRAGWRILLFIIIFWVFAATIFAVKPLFGDITKREFLQKYSLIIVSILAIGASVSVWLARTFVDKKSVRSLGLKWNHQTAKDLLFGFALSGLMAGSFLLILLVFNLVSLDGISFSSAPLNGPFDYVSFMKVTSVASLGLLLLEHILVGYWEELVFRGYFLQNMIEGMGMKIAIVVSCGIYGLIHMSNPNATLLSSLIIIIFGYLRIYGYLSTRMLWLSIGMHIGWNFFQGPIFGFAASGHQHATLLNINRISTHDWLTGGEFGPEGSVLILPIVGLALLAMKWYASDKQAITQQRMTAP